MMGGPRACALQHRSSAHTDAISLQFTRAVVCCVFVKSEVFYCCSSRDCISVDRDTVVYLVLKNSYLNVVF